MYEVIYLFISLSMILCLEKLNKLESTTVVDIIYAIVICIASKPNWFEKYVIINVKLFTQ